MSVPNRSSSLNRHGSSSPTTTPPPTVTPTATSALLANSLSAQDNQKLVKIRRFLGALIQFGQDTNAEIGERLRSLVMSIAVSLTLLEKLKIIHKLQSYFFLFLFELII
jgi:CBFA2/RNUX1 translocation partner 1